MSSVKVTLPKSCCPITHTHTRMHAHTWLTALPGPLDVIVLLPGGVDILMMTMVAADAMMMMTTIVAGVSIMTGVLIADWYCDNNNNVGGGTYSQNCHALNMDSLHTRRQHTHTQLFYGPLDFVWDYLSTANQKTDQIAASLNTAYTTCYLLNGDRSVIGWLWSANKSLHILAKTSRVHTDPGKSWKVLELKCWDFQAWKVLEKGIGPGKPCKSPGILKLWSWKYEFLVQVSLTGQEIYNKTLCAIRYLFGHLDFGNTVILC